MGGGLPWEHYPPELSPGPSLATLPSVSQYRLPGGIYKDPKFFNFSVGNLEKNGNGYIILILIPFMSKECCLSHDHKSSIYIQSETGWKLMRGLKHHYYYSYILNDFPIIFLIVCRT